MDFTFKRALGAGLLAFSVATVFSLQAEEKAAEPTAATDCDNALTGETTEVAMMMGGSGMGGTMGGGGAMAGGGAMGGGAMAGGTMGNTGNMAGGAMSGGTNMGGGAMSGGTGNMNNQGNTTQGAGTMTGGGRNMQRVDAGCEAGSTDCVTPVAVTVPIVEVEDQQAAMLAQVDTSKCNPAKAAADAAVN